MGRGRNRIGTISLVGAAFGFLFVTLQPWIPLDRVILFSGLSLKRLLAAFFDASLVGALADWFAVSALFRNPLGVRLPHTDILAKNKDSIAEAVPRFLTSFVTDEKIATEMGRIDFAAKAVELLAPGASRAEIHEFLRLRIASLLAGYAPAGGGSSGPSEGPAMRGLGAFIKELLAFIDEKIDTAAVFASFLRWTRREAFDERVIEALAELLRMEIGKNRSRLSAYITPRLKQNAGWQGLFIGQGTVERILYGLQEELENIRSDRRHELRAFLITALESYAARLAGEASDPAGERERFRAALRDAMASEAFQAGCAHFVAQLLGRLGADLSRPESGFIEGLERVEDALKGQLAGDAGLRERFNRGVAGLIAGLMARSRLVEGLTTYLAGLLKSTNERDFVQRVEDAVWNDLQYIRVNGAVVGGLVGLVLAVLSALLPG